jgi:hypothetical protein
MTTLNKDLHEREAIEALLPWHAAGTLSRRDSERVETALAGDRDLARQYEVVREELNETIYLNETLGAPSARAMEKLFSAIDAEGAGARQTRVSFNLGGRFSEFIASLTPRTLAWSATAAALAIVMQAAVLTTVLLNNDGKGGNFEVANASSKGSVVSVRFAPQASVADITKFLDAYNATVVGGPRPGDMYKLRISMTELPEDELTRVVGLISKEKVVGFAARSQATE